MTTPTFVLPTDLERQADDISADDLHFRGLLPRGHTLRSAVESDQLDAVRFDGAVDMARALMTVPVDEAVSDLLKLAYRDASKREPSQKWMAALRARYGVDGPPQTLQVAGELAGVSRERVRQVCGTVEPRVRGAWVPQMRPVLETLVENSPVSDPVGVLLSEEGLAGPNVTSDSILKFVAILGIDINAMVGTDLKVVDGWQVDVREASVTRAVRVARKHTSTFGMTTVEDIRQELSTKDYPADIEDVRRVLEADPRVGWDGEWLWVNKPDNGHASSMINTLRSMLSVNSPQTVQSLQEGIHRNSKFRQRDIVPPVAALKAFLKVSPYFTVSNGLVAPVEPLDYRELLGEVTASMIDVLKASPYQVMDRATLAEACADAGIAAGTASVWTTYAEWMERVATNVWGLRGSNPSPAVVKEVQRAAKARHQSEAHATGWTWTPDGEVALTMDVSTSSRTGGVFSFDVALSQTVGDRKFKMIVDGVVVGELRMSASHLWTWGWAKAFAATGAKVGDVLRTTLDLNSGIATVIKGGRSLWQRPG